MLQNPCKTLGFKKNMVYKIPPGGGKPYPASGQQTACLVVNPITVGNFAFLFNCTPVGRTSALYDGSDFMTYLLMRW